MKRFGLAGCKVCPPCGHPPLPPQAAAEVPTPALKLSAGRPLALHTQNLPQALLGSLQGVLEHGSLDMMPWPPRESKVTAPGADRSAPFSRGCPGTTGTAPHQLDTSPHLCLQREPPCITPKLMGARAEHMDNLLHRFCPFRYRQSENCCHLCADRATFWCHSSVDCTVTMWNYQSVGSGAPFAAGRNIDIHFGFKMPYFHKILSISPVL